MNDDRESHGFRRAAINQLLVEIFEESSLCDFGGGFRTPDEVARRPKAAAVISRPGNRPSHLSSRAAHTDAIIGWAFTSWALTQWFDAGLIELRSFTGGREAPAHLSFIGSERGKGRDGWRTVHPEEARQVLSHPERWHVGDDDAAGITVIRTDASDPLTFDDWAKVLDAARSTPPAIGADALYQANRAWFENNVDTGPLHRLNVFPSSDEVL